MRRSRAAPRARQVSVAVVALLAAATTTAVLLRHGWWAAVPVYLMLIGRGAQLALVDLREHRLPNRWTLGSLPWLIALLAVAGLVHGRPAAMVDAGVAALACGGLFLALALFAPTGLGMGDVKLAVLLGFAAGWLSLPVAAASVLFGFVVGGLGALALVLTRRAGRHTHIAFGPAMLAGAWLAMLGG